MGFLTGHRFIGKGMAFGLPPRMEELSLAILRVLEPTGLRQRVAYRVSGGLSAREVLDLLPGGLVAQLTGESAAHDPENVLGQRRAVDAVQKALITLVQENKLVRSQRSAWVELKSKGHRSVIVDVFRRV